MTEMIQMRISGRSMAPLLGDGQRVLVASLPEGVPVRVGEIVAVRDGGTGLPLLHRIVRESGGQYETLGDGNAGSEGPWRRADILGRLAAIEDSAGTWRRPRPFALRLSALTIRLPLGIRRRVNRLVAPFMAGAPVDLVAGPKEALCAAGSPEPDLPDHLEAQEVGRELFVHDRRTGDVVILNATARAVWSLSRSGMERDRIVATLHERYSGESPDRIRADVEDVLARVAGLTS